MWRIFRVTLFVILSLICALCGILMWTSYVEWRPASRESVDYSRLAPDTLHSDTITILFWNIGYAGLGAEMDFFYDGGRNVRDSRQETLKNMAAIKVFLHQHSSADFILLQEVDSTSKRNYDINLCKELTDEFPAFHPYYALNYNSPYVPIPILRPIGGVYSGLLTLSRLAPTSAIRYSLPSKVGYPQRLFDLKRAMLSLGFRRENGDMFYVNNVHCSAFDDGSMRRDEIGFIVDMMRSERMAITAGDWNSVPPTIPADVPATPQFTPHKIEKDVFPASWHISADDSLSSMRFNNRPYDAKSSLRATVDFALSTERIVPVECRVVDLGFANSDHNPVIVRYKIL